MIMEADEVTVFLSKVRIVIVSGIVKDSSGKPVAGAVIAVAGTTIGTVTGLEGKFSLEVPEDAAITVSMIGMNTVTVKNYKSDHLAITLTPQGSDQEGDVSSLSCEKDGTEHSANRNNDKKPLILVDGKKVANDQINKIDPNDIEDLKVIRGKEATKLYGEEAKNGVIIVTTKSKVDLVVFHPFYRVKSIKGVNKA
jgi:hypothetical protein